MKKLEKAQLSKYKKLLIGYLLFMFFADTGLRYHYNKRLIDSGAEPILDHGFSIIMATIFVVAILLFRLIEMMNEDES